MPYVHRSENFDDGYFQVFPILEFQDSQYMKKCVIRFHVAVDVFVVCQLLHFNEKKKQKTFKFEVVGFGSNSYFFINEFKQTLSHGP